MFAFALTPILAAADLEIELGPTSTVSGRVASDMVLIVGLAVLLFVTVIVWAVFIRGPRKHPSEDNSPRLNTPKATVSEDGTERRRKKKRTRRRDHRQRNPTLSQTGGLPPPREAEESPSV